MPSRSCRCGSPGRSRDDEELRYDPMCLTMKLFDVVIDQSGFGSEVVRQTVADALFPLLESLDEAAQDSL